MKLHTLRSLVIGLMLVITTCHGYQLPDLGTPSDGTLSLSEDQRLGTLFMQQVRHSVTIVQDPILTHYLNSLGKKLVANSNAHQRHFDFFIIDSSDINAFAGPGAHVGVNAGTLLLAHDEDEIAGVLAHEITHVSQHHLARAMEKARGSTLTALATIAAALIVGSATGQGDLAMGGLMAAQTLSMENQLGYSRENEREADRIGIQVLHNSQCDPQAMPRFLTRMSKQQIDLLDGRFTYLRTHPINEERIADAQSRADHYTLNEKHTDQGDKIHHDKLHANIFPSIARSLINDKSQVLTPRAHDLQPSLTFQLMQMRLLALSGDYNPTKIHHSLQGFSHKNSLDSLAQQYGYGLLLHRGRKLQEAENVMSILHQHHPDNIYFALALADIYVDQHHLAAAEQLLEKYHSTDPDYPPLLLSYSQVLMQQNRSQHALRLLDGFMKEHNNNNVDLLEQLAVAQAKNGYVSRAYLTRARLYRATDQLARARLQMQQALKYASASEKAFIKDEIQRAKDGG